MILAALAVAAMTAPVADASFAQRYGSFAYMAGRCYVHIAPNDVSRIVAEFDKQEPAEFASVLNDLYYDGIQRSRTHPVPKATCQKLLLEYLGG